MCSHVIKKK